MPVHASLFMVMPTLWNPVSLKFSDPVLEERYTSFRTQSTYSAIDTFYAWFSVGIGLVSAITAVIRGRELYLLASLVVGACGIFVLKAQRTNWYRNNRTVIMLVLRTLRMGNALVAITEPYAGEEELIPLLKFLSYCGFCVYQCCGHPVNFRIHAVHHSILVVFFFFFLHTRVCTRQLDIWSMLYNALTPGETSLLPLEEQCARFMLLLLFSVAYIVPTAILWSLECNSRRNYIDRMHIPLLGSVDKIKMALLVVSSCVAIWIIIAFTI